MATDKTEKSAVKEKKAEHKGEAPGAWAATVGGAGLGATAGYAVVSINQSKRGVMGAVADGAHKLLDQFKTPSGEDVPVADAGTPSSNVLMAR